MQSPSIIQLKTNTTMSRQRTIRRYTLIIEKINRNQFPSFEEIHNFLKDDGFEVSRRTVERDIAAIRNEFGVEITFNKYKEGYFIDVENSLQMDSFFRFLEIVNTAELLTESLSESKETLNYISFDQGGGLKGIELLKPLLNAIKNHRKIKFTHFSFQKEKRKKYSMRPYLLKEYQNRWYVVGIVAGIDELRTFGLDRIEALEVRDEIFKPDLKLNPLQKFDDAIGLIFSISGKQKVILSFSLSQGYYIKSLPMHHSQKILIDDEVECRFELNVVVNYELIQQILMHHHFVKVIEPATLQNEVKRLLKLALEQY
jgi:predicted DNA-binding transcriptional regulator YafY